MIAAPNPTLTSRSSIARQDCMFIAVLAALALGAVFDLAVVMISFATAVAISMAAVAAITDITRHKIYNWTTYPALGAGLVLSALASAMSRSEHGANLAGLISDVSFVNSVAGASVCGAAMFGSYLMSGGGAGDVKFAAALGALLGLHTAISAIAVAYIIAALVILVRVAAARLFGIGKTPTWSGRLNRAIPMGGYFAAGVAVVLTGVI